MTTYLALIFILKISTTLTEPFKDPAMSVASMRGLVYLENFLINNLNDYSQALQLKIDTIERFLTEVRVKQQESSTNREEYFANPLNSFSLIRRLHEDWSYMELYMSRQVGRKHTERIKRFLKEVAPKDLDLMDVMKAFVRMQSYYGLDATDLANGIIDEKQYSSKLTTLECYALAKFCLDNKLNQLALNWFQTALEQYNYKRDNELYKQVYKILLPELYDVYLTLLTTQGHDKKALNILNEISDTDVNFWLRRRYAEKNVHFNHHGPKSYIEEESATQLGCRNQFKPSTNLTCYLKKNISSFLILAPLKVELLSLKPYVALVHDAIYEKEIKQLTAQEPHTLKHDRCEQHKNSLKFTILLNNLTKVINARAIDMTDRTETYDERFLLINYGVGGHISLHRDVEYVKEKPGKQMTSIIFFLSDVLQGGNTVFPYKQLAIKPTKGAALVWHNMDNNNLADTVHASCPVLVGSKWTLVKWLWE